MLQYYKRKKMRAFLNIALTEFLEEIQTQSKRLPKKEIQPVQKLGGDL